MLALIRTKTTEKNQSHILPEFIPVHFIDSIRRSSSNSIATFAVADC